MEAVTITSVEDQVLQTVSGLTRLDKVQIDAMPAFMGEPDVMKSILYVPGVSTLGEGATGFNVRGGNTDENLILLGESSLFNANHAFGFFSGINTDVIENVKLYRGNMPAEYGGRLSSVMDIQLKNAHTEKFKLKGGIGPLHGKLLAEIPLQKGTQSLLIGGRSLYSDWLLDQVQIPDVQNSSVFFYDLNLRYFNRLSDRSKLTASLYSSLDDFEYAREFGFEYRTLAANLNLTHILNREISSSLDVSYGSYSSTRQDLIEPGNSAYDTQIRYYQAKGKITYSPSDRLSLTSGVSMIYYHTQPGTLAPLQTPSVVKPVVLPDQQAIEAAAFVSTELTIGTKWTLTPGLRISYFNALGPGQRFVYQDDQNPLISEITGSLSFASGESLAHYATLEPRLALNYQWAGQNALKLG